MRTSHIVAVTMGNALEFYDFLIYATFAIYIGRAYFPTHDPVASLLFSLATFGIGFVTRPIGGMVLGRLGDVIGRKPSLLISFSLMAVGLLGIAVTPTYAQIGIAAPIIVIAARLVQGFALGGEVGPSTAFLVEGAAGPRRGLVGGMQNASQGLAILCASGVAVLISYTMPPAALEQWGWRLAFLVGLVIVPFGLIVRRNLPETAPHPLRTQATGERQRVPWRLVLMGGMLITSGTICSYIGNYMTTYALDTLHLPARTAFTVGIVNGLCAVVFVPIGGWLSDRYGRRVVMLPAMVFGLVVGLPSMALLLAHPSAFMLNTVMASWAIPSAVGAAAMMVSITESFPPRMRCMAVGTIYALAVAFFGGTTQFVLAGLLHLTGDPMVLGYYRMVALAIGLVAVLNMTESAPVKIGSAEPGARLAPA